MKYIFAILLLFLSTCSPIPNKVSTEFKTGEQGEYQGTDVGFTWEL